jgi:COMPASS component BRE2
VPVKRKLADSAEASPTPPPLTDSATLCAAPVLVPGVTIKDMSFFSTRGHPINRPNYRYLPCGPSPSSTPDRPIFRIIESPPANLVRFSWEDRSPYTYVTSDALAITTEKGFRGGRANVPIREGDWYFEVVIERGGGEDGSYVRLGVGRRECSVNAPVGFDGFSYGIRDRTGDKVTLSQPRRYGQSFGTGDVIGVHVSLPKRRPPAKDDPRDPSRIVRKRIPIRYKGQLYFESLEYAPSKEMVEMAETAANPKPKVQTPTAKKKAAAPGQKAQPTAPVQPPPRPLPTLKGSKLSFFKNGEPMSKKPAFTDLFDYVPLRQHTNPPKVSGVDRYMLARENHHDDGTLGYYPFVSVYRGGVARIQAGPDFAFPPPEVRSGKWRPLSDRYDEYKKETALLDEADEILAQRAFTEEAAEAARAVKAQKKKKSTAATTGRVEEKKGTATPPLQPPADATATATSTVATKLDPRAALLAALSESAAIGADSDTASGMDIDFEAENVE